MMNVSDHITVKTRGGIHVLRLYEIDWVQANQDYAALHVGGKSWLIREPMHSLASRLACAGFIRIHRSTLLNAQRVRELRPLSKGEFTVVLTTGAELKLSRSYRSAVAALGAQGCSSRKRPPSAAATDAMNAPINNESAV